MKFTAIALGLIISMSSFAVEDDDFVLTNVPTASRTYKDKIYDESEIESASAALQERCRNGKASAENFSKSSGYKVLRSVGCEHVSVDNRNSDQTYDGIFLSTSFQVQFK